MDGERLGFEIVSVLLKAEHVDDLDTCMRVVNNAYAVLRNHLMVLEEIKNGERVW